MGARRKKKRRQKQPAQKQPQQIQSERKSGAKRPVLILIAAAAGLGLAAFLWLSGGEEVTPTKPLNLILISVDTLRADHLSCYGSTMVETPGIDRLSREGVLFEQVQTVAPTTLPSHASLFTGVTPLRHGVRDNVGFYLPPEIPTLASVLTEAGYRTGGFVGAFVMDSRFGIGRGFETYFDQFETGEEDIAGGFVSQRRGEVVLEQTLNWMEESRSEPFFAFLHFYDPHTPYEPPPAFAPREASNQALYRGEVEYVDSLVDWLLDWLQEKGLEDQTVVALTSDHGEALGEHGELTHGFFLYEATLHVPLLLRFPEAPSGMRIPHLVRLIDVAPTLLDLLGKGVPEGLDGASLVPLLKAPGKDPELQAYAETFLPRLHYGWSELRSLRRDGYKLILAPRSELYQIEQDPTESIDLSRTDTDRSSHMENDLQAMIENAGTSRPEPAELDEQSRAALRALGYIGGDSKETSSVPYHALPDPKDRVAIYEKVNDPMFSDIGPEAGQIFQRALSTLREVVTEDPSIPRAHLLYGEALLKAGRDEEAARSLERALALQPENFTATYGLAVAQMSLGRLEEAEANLRGATQLEPRNTKSYFRLAELETERGNLDAAERWLREAIEIHSDRVLQERLADVLLQAGKTAEAEKILDDLRELYGTDAVALYNLGQAQLSRGDVESALKTLREASRLAPQDADIHQALGNALAASGDFSSSLAEYQRALEISPCFTSAHSNLGAALTQLTRFDEAVASYQQAITCDPEYGIGYKNLAAVLLQMGDFDGAAEALNTAARLLPGDAEIRTTLDELEKYRDSRR